MSRLADMQARFQQKQMQEKEEKLLKLYENQQQRAFERVGRGSATNSLGGGTSPVGAGKVRQMFDERRQKAGIDRSYPLEPLKQKNGYAAIANRVPNLDRSNNTISRNTIKTTSSFKSTVQRTVTQSRNGGKPVTYAARQTAEATFVNGELRSGNVEYRVRDDADALDLLRGQERELELLMKNHRLDDEKFIEVGIEGLEEVDGVGDHERPVMKAIENGNVDRNVERIVEKKENGFRKPVETVSAGHTPVKKTPPKTSYAALREKTNEKLKRPVMKTQSTPLKSQSDTHQATSRPQSSTVYHPPQQTPPTATPEKRAPPMKSATPRRSVASPRPATTRSQPSPLSRVQSGNINRDDLKPCTYCSRRFAADRIQMHEDICARTLKKKRKTYDPVKHRVQGTDAETYVKKNTKGSNVSKVSKKEQKPHQVVKTDWRRQHEEFISAIRAAKQAQAHVARGGKLTDLPPPPPSLNPDYIQCPHCGRRFNEAAAARHIPKCATMLHNKPSRAGVPPKKRA